MSFSVQTFMTHNSKNVQPNSMTSHPASLAPYEDTSSASRMSNFEAACVDVCVDFSQFDVHVRLTRFVYGECVMCVTCVSFELRL